MEQVGNRYEAQTRLIMRLSAVVAPVLLSLYATILALQSDTLPLFSSGILLASWVLLGLATYLQPPSTHRSTIAVVVLYHVYSALYITTVIGLSNALFSWWVLLYVASFLLFGIRGFGLSGLILLLTIAIGSVAPGVSSDTAISSYIGATAATVVAILAIALLQVREHDREVIAKTRLGEELQRERMLTLVNNLADAIIAVDATGKIDLYNAAFASLIDTNASVTGKTVDSLLKLKNSDNAPIRLSTLLKRSKALTITDEFTTKVGAEELRLELTYSPIRGSFDEKDNRHGYLVIVRDVTKAKSLEEERDEFISVVSHELRTPIAISEGALDNAKMIFDKDPTKTAAVSKSIHTAHDQILYLGKMVNDLSTLSRAERGVADEPELIDVQQLAHDLHSEYAPEAEAKGLRFELSAHGDLGQVIASRLYLQELLQNFITNAIKYTNDGHVSLAIKKKDGRVFFDISDSGIGISKSDQEKIFHKFYRAEDYRTRETSGTGLGLYVAAKLSRKLGTEIHVKSRLNHGSTFTISLPLSEK